MEKDDVFEIFSILSKAVIIVPIMVVFIGLIYRFNQSQNSPLPLRIEGLTGQAKPKIKNQATQTKINIDLKGPLVCDGKIDNLIINAFIKDKKIKAVLNQNNIKSNVLFNGDCYYRWQEGEYVGERVCGLSPFMSVAETMMNFGGLNLNSITSQLAKLGLDQKIATNQAKITELVQSCKKKDIDTKTFVVPNNILFKNKN